MRNAQLSTVSTCVTRLVNRVVFVVKALNPPGTVVAKLLQGQCSALHLYTRFPRCTIYELIYCQFTRRLNTLNSTPIAFITSTVAKQLRSLSDVHNPYRAQRNSITSSNQRTHLAAASLLTQRTCATACAICRKVYAASQPV